MAELLSSKVVIEEEPPKIRTIVAGPTADTGFVGVTERGPLGVATLVTSFDEYTQLFGGYTANSDVALAVAGFFQNGGQRAYIVRVVHYTAGAPPTKNSAVGTLMLQTAAGAPTQGYVQGTIAGPYDFAPADTIIVDVDIGGATTATFDAAAAVITGTGTEVFTLADAMTLTVKIDGGSVQTIIFNTAEFVDITNATALEVAAVINAEIVGAWASVSASSVRITADSMGLASEIEVTGGTSNAQLIFSTSPVNGTGDVDDINAVTVAEIKSVVEADVSGCTVSDVSGKVRITSDGTPGPSSSIQVTSASTADTIIGVDNATHSGSSGAAANTLKVDGKTDGIYANVIKAIIAAATSGSSTELNLSVEVDGVVAEVFPNVSMDDTAERFVETIINGDDGSNLITVTDQDTTAADPRPAVGTFGPLTGGDDGLSGIADVDYVGTVTPQLGMLALNTIQGIRILTVPGRATSAVHNGMVTYCEITRKLSIFPILDPPAGYTAAQIVTYQDTTAQLLNLSEHGAMYWPRVKVLNPAKTVFGSADTIVVPPSGHLAGLYARVDGATPGGVYKAPAGTENGILRNVLGFETEEVLDEARRDLVYPKRINPITTLRGAPIFVDGSRTLKGNGNFPSIPERRGVIFIEQSLKDGLVYLKHQPNTLDNRAAANRTVTLFLINQMRNGAFASNDASKAFFVDTSVGVNTAAVIAANKMKIKVGLATSKPTEWIIITISQDTRALDEEVAAAS